MTRGKTAARLSEILSRRLYNLVNRIASLPDLKVAVEANHDNNRWWPKTVDDPRIRMLVAGWSARVSYSMVDSYALVVRQARNIGYDRITRAGDDEIARLVRPIGLATARITYLRSLTTFLARIESEGTDPLADDAAVIIQRFAKDVRQASFKVAQCAILYARGYHCGIIPVDDGMVRRLAPVLGLYLPAGPKAHEHMRRELETSVAARPDDYRELAQQHRYRVTIPADVPPTWWVHLMLIYFKRLYLNRPASRLCPARPVCNAVLDCPHSDFP